MPSRSPGRPGTKKRGKGNDGTPRNSPDELREDIHEAVDQAVEAILKADLKDLMERVETTAWRTVDARLQRWATTVSPVPEQAA